VGQGGLPVEPPSLGFELVLGLDIDPGFRSLRSLRHGAILCETPAGAGSGGAGLPVLWGAAFAMSESKEQWLRDPNFPNSAGERIAMTLSSASPVAAVPQPAFQDTRMCDPEGIVI
jgi:hypothetical protein